MDKDQNAKTKRFFKNQKELDAVIVRLKKEKQADDHNPQWEPPEEIPEKIRRIMPIHAKVAGMLEVATGTEDFPESFLRKAKAGCNYRRKLIYHRWKLGFYEVYADWLEEGVDDPMGWGHGFENV